MNAYILSLEENLASGFESRRDEVFHNFLLRVDRDRAAGQFLEIDAMTASIEANFHAVVDQPLPLHSIAHVHFCQQLDRALLQHPGSYPLFTVLPTSRLDHD